MSQLVPIDELGVVQLDHVVTNESDVSDEFSEQWIRVEVAFRAIETSVEVMSEVGSVEHVGVVVVGLVAKNVFQVVTGFTAGL